MINKCIYVDNAATTPLSPRALAAMLPYLTEHFGNPSGIYSLGIRAKIALDQARDTIASYLKADPREVFFTSGGSEANNWAIKGAAFDLFNKGKRHIVVSNIEHHAVLHTVEDLKQYGFEVSLLRAHADGIVRPEDLLEIIRPDTALVSVMFANNEIGTIQPIKALGEICRKHGVLFHTDAVQAVGTLPIDVQDMCVDMLSLSAHKFHGPKGIGALYIRRGVKIHNLIHGGSQESNLRAGTENVASIVGMATALREACDNMHSRNIKLSDMRDRLINGLLRIDQSILNGHPSNRLPGNVNVCFRGVEGEALLLMLDKKGICASSGSACTSGSLDPSHVLLAIGLPHATAHGSLRITLSDENSDADIDYILEVMPGVVETLRAMSPLWEKILNEEN